MKLKIVSIILVFISMVCANASGAFNTIAEAVYINVAGTDVIYDINSGTGSSNYFSGVGAGNFLPASLGAFNYGSVITLTGAAVVANKPGGNFCSATYHYVVYPKDNRPAIPTFTTLNIAYNQNCPGGGSFTSPGIGPCNGDQQVWATQGASINLTNGLCPDDYTLEMYISYTGSASNSGDCSETGFVNNSGSNFKTDFTINSIMTVNVNTPVDVCTGSKLRTKIITSAAGSVKYQFENGGTQTDKIINATLMDSLLVDYADYSAFVTGNSLTLKIISTTEAVSGCTETFNTSYVIGVSPLPTISLNSSYTYCSINTTASISATINNADASTVMWTTSNGLGSFSPASGSASTIYTINVADPTPTNITASVNGTAGCSSTVVQATSTLSPISIVCPAGFPW